MRRFLQCPLERLPFKKDFDRQKHQFDVLPQGKMLDIPKVVSCFFGNLGVVVAVHLRHTGKPSPHEKALFILIDLRLILFYKHGAFGPRADKGHVPF